MVDPVPHRWPGDPADARALQERLRAKVETRDRLRSPVVRVAGLDVHYAPRSDLVWAAATVLKLPALDLEWSALACRPLRFPYVPGLLSFREAPAMLAALSALPVRPDLLMVDGQGIAHPRRLGLAAHVGVLADIPTIGVAKSRLIGMFKQPGARKGSRAPLTDDGEVIGAVVRSRDRVKPLFVSVGHRVSLETAVTWVLRCADRVRLPEPTRLADRLSRCHDP